MRPMFFKSWVFKAYSDDGGLLMIYILAFLFTLVVVPIIIGAWFNSWWWWFGVLWVLVFFSLMFFFLVDWFVLALLLTGAGALFWGASGYVFGLFLSSHISWAPPPLILAIQPQPSFLTRRNKTAPQLKDTFESTYWRVNDHPDMEVPYTHQTTQEE